MADLTCLIEVGVSSNSGVVEESTLSCLISVGVGVPDFGLTGEPLKPNVGFQAGVGVGAQAWCDFEIPTITVPLTAGVGITIGCSLIAGVPAVISLEVGIKIASSLSLIAPVLLPKVVGLAIGVVVSPCMGLNSLAPTTASLGPTIGIKVATNFGLVAVSLPSISTVVMTTPIAKGVGVSLELVTQAVPSSRVLSSIITMRVGASFGLVSNAILSTIVLCNGGTCREVSCFSAEDVTEIFETWVFTGNNYNPSVYSGFDFNSYARYKGRDYAAGAEGIYLLDGADDDGDEIHSGIRIVTNFGSDRDKRMRGIQFGSSGPDTNVRVESETGEGTFTPGRDDNRVVVSREIQGRIFTIDVMDFQELNQLELMSLPLARR